MQIYVAILTYDKIDFKLKLTKKDMKRHYRIIKVKIYPEDITIQTYMHQTPGQMSFKQNATTAKSNIHAPSVIVTLLCYRQVIHPKTKLRNTGAK